jgi:hypothetical protein
MNIKQAQNGGRKERPNMTPQANDALLTLDELAARLQLHPDTARGLYRRKVIPGIKLGHRTLRFEYGKVLDALRRAGDPAADTAAR